MPKEQGKPPSVTYTTEHRAWFKSHKDPVVRDNWEASLRLSPSIIKYLTETKNPIWEAGYVVLPETDEEGIVKILNFREEARQRTNQILREAIQARAAS